ncbi:MAG: GDP-L-fucose synthase [Bacteriovoracaceae bacterium]|jgi:GDP-L-fucose synthase
MNKDSKILILGSGGLVGSSLVKVFKKNGFENLLTPVRSELNLLNQSEVDLYFKTNLPEIIINAAAKVGGIHANKTYQADFIFENISIQNNLFKASFENKVDTFLFLGSSCIYPRECPQPIKEEYLLTGPLEPTNEPYAIAKISGLKTAEYFNKQYGLNYFSVMPTNLYGENDNFHPENSHVIPGLISRMQKAIDEGEVLFKAWGTGAPKREFLYVDDLSEACLFLLMRGKLDVDWINVGTGSDISIKELVELIAEIMEYKGEIVFDTEQPDGTPRKVLNVEKMNSLGWSAKVGLREGLVRAVKYFRNAGNYRK